MSKKDIFAITIILGFSLFSTSLIRDNSLQAILYNFDDAISFSVIKNINTGNGFVTDLAGYYTDYGSEQFFHNYPEVINPFNQKGPIYYLTTSFLFNALSINPENYLFYGSYTNTLFFSLSLVLLFFLLRKYYEFNIAFFSTITIASISFFNWSSVRLLTFPLLMLFFIAALFFLKNKNSHYIIFGIFGGLAHLTHPQGMLLSVSYATLLLVERKFKGFLILLTTYFLILSPWLIRNIIVFNSPNEGLQLPFLDNVWSLLGFRSLAVSFTPTLSISNNISPFELLQSFIQQGISFYYVNTVSILILILLSSLTLLVCFRYKKNTKLSSPIILKSVLNRITIFGLVFLMISIIALTYKQTIASVELRLFLPAMIFLIPASIFLIFKLINQISHNFKPKFKIKIFLILIVIFFISLDYYNGINKINSYLEAGGFGRQNEYVSYINSWIKNQTSSYSVIATDTPAAVMLGTGRSSVGMPTDISSPIIFNEYVDNYSPQYFILYSKKYSSDFITSINLNDLILQRFWVNYYDPNLNLDYNLLRIYSFIDIKDVFMHKINSIRSENPDIQDKQLVDLLLFESLDNETRFNIQQLNEIAKSYENKNEYYKAIEVYGVLSEVDRLNFTPYIEKSKLFHNDKDRDNQIKELKLLIKNLVYANSLAEKLNESNLAMTINQKNRDIILELANVYAEEGHRSQEFFLYKDLLEEYPFDPFILYQYGKASEKLEYWSEALKAYDYALRLGYDNPEEIEIHISTIHDKLKP